MKVRELIELLKQVDSDLEVVVDYDDSFYKVKEIKAPVKCLETSYSVDEGTQCCEIVYDEYM